MALDALIGMDPESAWPILQRIGTESGSAELRARSVWLLSQVDTDEAFDLLVAMARSDPDPEVRGQALFWLGQQGGSLDMLGEIALNDPDEELRAQALFGIAQIESEEANEFLLQIARSDAQMEVRSNAIFLVGAARR